MRDYKKLLNNKNFLYLWSSQIFSQLTINIMNFLLLIKLFNATGSTIATSFLWVAYALPAILIGPFAAACVDMVERRKILIVTNLLQSLTIFLYAFVHETRLFLLYGIALLYSFLNQFYVPAESASLPSLVKKEDYPHANGLFFLTQQASIIIGFGIAGILNSLLGFEKSLFLCAFFLFLAFLSVIFLPTLRVRTDIPRSFEEGFFKFFSRILEGYKFIKGNKSILIPFSLLIILQISLAIITVNIPIIVKEILNTNVNSSGILIVVPAGIGAAIGALTVPKIIKKKRKKVIIDAGLMLMVLASFLLTFLIPLLNGAFSIWVCILTIIMFGFAFMEILLPAQTFLQEKTPGGLRGRVFGNFWFLATISTIFPVIFSGALVDLFGVKFLFFLLGMIYLIILIFSKKIGQNFIDNGFELTKK